MAKILMDEESTVAEENPIWRKFARAMAPIMIPAAHEMARLLDVAHRDPRDRERPLPRATGDRARHGGMQHAIGSKTLPLDRPLRAELSDRDTPGRLPKAWLPRTPLPPPPPRG